MGDGKRVDAWNDVWIEPNLRIKDMNLVIPNELRAVKVADLVNDEGEWKWELLNAWLPLEVLHKIETIPPPHIIYGSDVRESLSGDHKNYSVAALYQELGGFQNNIIESNWCMIWKLAVPKRVRCFMWLMRHERLLTNYAKSRMGIGSSMCAYCGSVSETVLHAMRDCALAMPLWMNVVHINNREVFFMGDLQHWIHFNLSTVAGWNTSAEWRAFWAVAMSQFMDMEE